MNAHTRHTPGPWRTRFEDSGMCNGVAVGATILPPKPFTGPYIAYVGSSAANAHLIAAAPDMRQALAEVLGDCYRPHYGVARCRFCSEREGDPHDKGCTIATVLHAVAKADGVVREVAS